MYYLPIHSTFKSIFIATIFLFLDPLCGGWNHLMKCIFYTKSFSHKAFGCAPKCLLDCPKRKWDFARACHSSLTGRVIGKIYFLRVFISKIVNSNLRVQLIYFFDDRGMLKMNEHNSMLYLLFQKSVDSKIYEQFLPPALICLFS